MLTATLISEKYESNKLASSAHPEPIGAVASLVIQRLKEMPIPRTADIAVATIKELGQPGERHMILQLFHLHVSDRHLEGRGGDEASRLIAILQVSAHFEPLKDRIKAVSKNWAAITARPIAA